MAWRLGCLGSVALGISVAGFGAPVFVGLVPGCKLSPGTPSLIEDAKPKP